MSNNQYAIKITGTGTAKEILESLKVLTKALKMLSAHPSLRKEVMHGAIWEDKTLVTEIKAE